MIVPIPFQNENKLPSEAEAQEMLEIFLDFPEALQHSPENFMDYKAAAKSLQERRERNQYGSEGGSAKYRDITVSQWFYDSSLTSIYCGEDRSDYREPWYPKEVQRALRFAGDEFVSICSTRQLHSRGALAATMNSEWGAILDNIERVGRNYFIEHLMKKQLIGNFSEKRLLMEIEERTKEFRGPFYILCSSDYLNYIEATTGSATHFEGIPIIHLDRYSIRPDPPGYSVAVIAKDQFKANHSTKIWGHIERIPRYWRFGSVAVIKFKLLQLKGDGSEETILDEMKEEYYNSRFTGI